LIHLTVALYFAIIHRASAPAHGELLALVGHIHTLKGELVREALIGLKALTKEVEALAYHELVAVDLKYARGHIGELVGVGATTHQRGC
jgi:hypothetical protein